MYFFSKIYKGVKGFVAVSGTAGSLLAIIYGALQTGGSVFVVGGTLCLANSLFNIVEIGKVDMDIRRQITQLDSSLRIFLKQLDDTRVENERHERNNTIQRAENSRLRGMVNKSEKHITRLEGLQQDILAAKDDLQKENKDLLATKEHLTHLKDAYSKENNDLKNTVEDLEKQLSVVIELKKTTIEENEELRENIIKQAEIIKESKRVIQNLATFGDSCTAFGETLDNDLKRLSATDESLETTASVLRKITNKLRGETFEVLDQDRDGVITAEEFTSGLEKL